MSRKEEIKKLLGYNNILRIKKIISLKKYLFSLRNNSFKTFDYDTEIFCCHKEIKQSKKNIFFGYYDLKQIDKAGQRALVHINDKKSDPAVDDVDLAFFDICKGTLSVFAKSSAWSRQQGSRLRWHPSIENSVIYNDFDGQRYISRIFDLEKNRVVENIPIALYDIDSNGEFGLGLNFSRLQRLRPGYGYSRIADITKNENIPKNDGIFLWSKNSHEVKLIVPLSEVAKSSGIEDAQHYFNHISISPSGRRFMFFHLWSFGLGTKWGMNLYVCNIDGSDLRCVDDSEIISHYCWYDDNILLTTALASEKMNHSRYILYDIENNKKTVIQSDILEQDGHPTFTNNGSGFITDTYPLKDCMQYVFYSDIKGDLYKELIKVYANPFLIDEHRCDLHPRLDEEHGIISIDTSYSGLRSVLMLKLRNKTEV